MANELAVMITAVVIAVAVMLVAAGPISDFVERHPTVKMLALSLPAADRHVAGRRGLGQHIPKGYIYFAMGFSVFVEMLNLRMPRAKASRCTCTSRYVAETAPAAPRLAGRGTPAASQSEKATVRLRSGPALGTPAPPRPRT